MQVELLKPHEHAGKRHEVGAVLMLADELAQWLLDIGVARATRFPKTTKPALSGDPGLSTASQPFTPEETNP